MKIYALQLVLAGPIALIAASPAIAQDHSAHAGHAKATEQSDHAGHSSQPPTPPPTVDVPLIDIDDLPSMPVDHSQMDHGAMDHSAHGEPASDTVPLNETPPAEAMSGPRHAADAVWGAAAMEPSRQQLAREHGKMRTGTFMLERLEARVGEHDGYLWDAQAWYGGDDDKLWLKSEGEGEFGGLLESAEIQALWSNAIGPFWDLQTGIRYDAEPDSRAYGVLGLQGLAPYMFEVDAALFLSDQGDLTARIEGEYDQRITQRLILQPRVELNFSAQDIAMRGIASGLTSVEAGLRLRYELAREFAPYIGIEYEGRTGATADLARGRDEDTGAILVLAGIRTWF